MIEYICTKDNDGCVGYNNGQCITFENCMYKKEKEDIKIEKARKPIYHDIYDGYYEYCDFYVVKHGNKVIYESQDDPTKLIEYFRTLN